MNTIATCLFCGGTGKDPFNLLSKTSQCQVCNGVGTILLVEPFMKCVFCSGTGKNPLGARVPCIVCKGKGSNSNTSDVVCIKCFGTGRASDGLPCTGCKGTGYKESIKL